MQLEREARQQKSASEIKPFVSMPAPIATVDIPITETVPE